MGGGGRDGGGGAEREVWRLSGRERGQSGRVLLGDPMTEKSSINRSSMKYLLQDVFPFLFQVRNILGLLAALSVTPNWIAARDAEQEQPLLEHFIFPRSCALLFRPWRGL